MSELKQASRPTGRSRKPKVYAAGRVCRRDDCDTKVSRYNQSEYCFRHTPARFPRLRGVVQEAS